MSKNSFLSQFEGKDKPTPVAEAKKPGISAPDHLVLEDKGFHQRKIVKWSIMGGAAILIALLGFFGFRMARAVEVMDFTGMGWNQATQWGLQHGITLQRSDAFNLEFEEGDIFGQNREAGTNIQRGSVIIVDVSQGADPNEVLDLPDFEAMTTGQVQTWRTQMRATSAITVREQPSDTVAAGRLIELEHAPNVDLDHFTRRDNLTLIMSSGPRIWSMPNFVGRSRTDVDQWAEENQIHVEFEERAEAEAEPGTVLAQNIEPRTRFTNDDEVRMTVSAGKAVVIPNFSLLAPEDLDVLEGIQVLRRDRFNPHVAFGRVVSQSLPAGTEVIGEVPKVTVVYSLGRPFMPNLIGQMENVVPQLFFEEFTSRGANLTYAIRYVNADAPRGEIVAMSRHSQFVAMNEHILIDVSRGNLNATASEAPATEGDDVAELG